MANKIKLGNRPKTFKPFYVKFPMPDGTEGRIQVTFKYFTKIESGKLFDDLIAEAKDNAKTDEEKAEVEAAEVAFSLQDIMEKNRDHNSGYLIRVVDAWDLDEPLSLETLQQLDDEIPASTVAIMTGFREATQSGRLGN